MRHALPLLALLPLLGCASQAQRPEPSLAELGVVSDTETGGWRRPTAVRTPVESPTASPVTDEEIRRALAEGREAREKPLAFPVRVVALEIAAGAEGVEARPLAANDLETLRKSLGTNRLVERIETIPSLFLPIRPDLASLRFQAARFGADVLVLVTRATNAYDYANGWAFLYPTFVGLFLAPGRSLEVWTAAEAALVGVADGRPLAVVEADAREDVSLLLVADDELPRRELEEASQTKLMAELAGRIEEQLR